MIQITRELKVENIEQIKKEIHKNSIAHGWWTEPRPFGEICALIHSELSEALEEYRNMRPCVYIVKSEEIKAISPEQYQLNGEKPEGIAVELADAVIRILDYMDEMVLDYLPDADEIYKDIPLNFGEFIALCHSDITDAYNRSRMGEGKYYEKIIGISAALSVCISRIDAFCESCGLDLSQVIALKHEYNKTRPYRHGGKLI